MKRIALVTTLAALAAPASVLAENSTHSITALTSPSAATVTEESVAGFGPWREYFQGMRLRAFHKKQQSDDGDSGSGLDEGRGKPSGEDNTKNRTWRRRQAQDPGDSRRDGPDLNERYGKPASSATSRLMEVIRQRAFRVKKQADDGDSSGLDDGRREPAGEYSKNRTQRRRQGQDAGDSGRKGRGVDDLLIGTAEG